MVFSSVEFLLYFLPIFFLFYWISPKKFKNFTLLLGSLFFYAKGEPAYLALLIGSVYCNYYIGLCLGKNRSYHRFEYNEKEEQKEQKKKRRLLVAAVAVNLGVLVLFKCHVGGLAFPLGLSFYTFQILAYLIDVYRGTVTAEGSMLQFGVYITMFPKLISGPLVDYNTVKSELSQRQVTSEIVQEGLKLFTVGLGLKVLLADRIGILWHEVQVTGFESISTPLAWLAALAYSMKIYFDFYGYSLMALGLGKMLGFTLPKNFNHPYGARSVRDFYRRWHMTLGQWFCRYVYIPLGGSRGKELRCVCNLFVVWMLTALWHGTTVNFFLWGGVLWFCIVLERQLQKTGLGKFFKILPHLYLWVVIPVSWMCFAITDLGELGIYLSRMAGLTAQIQGKAGDWQGPLCQYGGLLLVSFMGCTSLPEKLYEKYKNRLPVSVLLAVIFWLCVHRIIMEGNNPFMYFRF